MDRATMLSAVEDLVDIAKKEEEEFVFFIPKKIPLSEEEIMENEYNLLGYYITKHPLDSCSTRINDLTKIADLPNYEAGKSVTVGGILAEVKCIKTRAGKEMAFIQLEDLTGRTEVVVFPGTFAKIEELLVKNAVVEISGKLELEENEIEEAGEIKTVYNPKILMYKIKPLAKMGKINHLYITVTKRDELDKINKVLNDYPGEIPVSLEYQNFQLDLKKGFAQSTKAISVLEQLCLLKEVKE